MKLLCFMLSAALLFSVGCTPKAEQPNGAAASGTGSKAPAKPISTIGILLYDGYTLLDAVGPYQVLSELADAKVFFIGRRKGLVSSGTGIQLQVDTTMEAVKQLDVLVVPGGFRETYAATRDMALVNWIRAIDSGTVYTTSVCTGAWILGAAGLLNQKQATTHWYGKKILASQFGAKVQDKRYVNDGKYWTSAGVTAGMDMSLALLADIKGDVYTRTAMLDLEYDPQPPFTGGSERNTDQELVQSLRARYNAGMETALHPERAYRAMKFDNTTDFVCGMPVRAGVADTCHYKGKVFGFCATACKEAFVENPGAYMALK